MNKKRLTDSEKQFTILPNEVDPKMSLAKANQAISKALVEIKNTRKIKAHNSFK